MRRLLVILIASIVLDLGAAPVPAARAVASMDAFDAATVREAADLLKEKRAAEALPKLAPLAPKLKDNAEFETLYGEALIDAGQPRDGASALRRALAAQPDNLAARAHLGRALAAIGDFNGARKEIAAVRDRPDLPAEIQVVMAKNLETIDGALKQQADVAKKPQLAQASIPAGPPATENDLATIRSAAELVRAKKSAAALAKLEPLADRLSGNPDFDYVYGIAAIEDGHPAQAAVALRRAVAARSDFHLARAELGRALAAMGDLAGAKREFQVVRDAKGLPALARDAMGRQVIAIDEALRQIGPAGPQAPPAKPQAPQPRTRISGYLEHSVGYDSNVNSGPSSESLLIPALAFLGPATLAPEALPKHSWFYELAGGVSIVHAVNDDTAIFANAIGNWHPLFENQEFRTSLAGGEAGIARQFGDFGVFSLAGVGQTFLMDDRVFRNLYGAAGQWRRRYADAWDVGFALSWLRLEYPNQVNQDTDRYSAIGTIGRKWDALPLAPAVTVTGTVGKEVARTPGMDFLSFTLLGARVGVETTWSPWFVAFLQASYEDRQYDADFPLFFEHRHDGIVDALGGFEVKIAENLSLRPSVHYSKTNSNVDLFDQTRWIGASAVRWTF